MAIPIITRIEEQLQNSISGIKKQDHYLLNWAPCNIVDRTLESSNYQAFGTLKFVSEINQETPQTNFANRYINLINYTLDVRIPMLLESTNPKFDGINYTQKAISDIKRLLAEHSSLDTDYIFLVKYMGSNKINSYSDRFTSCAIQIQIQVEYHQDRINPSISTD